MVLEVILNTRPSSLYVTVRTDHETKKIQGAVSFLPKCDYSSFFPIFFSASAIAAASVFGPAANAMEVSKERK